MQLVEREGFLALLASEFRQLARGEGRSVFLSGEAGMGKTSLVKTFCEEHSADCKIYKGFCDALFSPRLLAPLYDVILQVEPNLLNNDPGIEHRAELFSGFFRELKSQKGKVIILFEDIHWADEATLDFIKFFARRISQLPCLLILTYRDDEIYAGHSLRNLIGQLARDSFTRIRLTPLSRKAVDAMATEKGYSGEDVYTISGGNPFYVNEILSSYSPGVPDNIRDSVIAVYNRQEERTKEIWEILSVVPDRFEIKYLEKMAPFYAAAIDRCLETRILLMEDGYIFFKHELFRRTIEAFLSPLKRVSLNKKILELFLENFEQNKEIERIIHHAKNAHLGDLVVQYAPIGALKAATLGAHIEASKLYFAAIEYYKGKERNLLIELYELYAYECYLTNQIKEAIVYTEKAMALLTEKDEKEKIGNCMRFLSRLSWLDGNRKNAERFSEQAIEVLDRQPSSPAKAMAYSNMSQLKMLSDQSAECIRWGEKAITMAVEISDEATLSHALNNVGTMLMLAPASGQKGIGLLQQSLEIALKNSFHDHAARAYTNMGSIAVKIKNFPLAKKILDEGIQYCEERDLDSWRSNTLSLKANLNLDTGDWNKAYGIAESLLKNENPVPPFAIDAYVVTATIKMRRGDHDPLPLLRKAETMAFGTREMQRIIPTLVALLEYEWLKGEMFIKTEDLERTVAMFERSINHIENSEFAYWLYKARKQKLPLKDLYEGYDVSDITRALKAATLWGKLGSPYQQALCLFEGTETDKRQSIRIIHELGANAVSEKLKLEMRMAGIRKIPRGIRETTRANPYFLTSRELDVLKFLKEGMHNKEIASELYISARTVDHHISSLFFKLNVNSRIRAVDEAVRLGIIK